MLFKYINTYYKYLFWQCLKKIRSRTLNYSPRVESVVTFFTSNEFWDSRMSAVACGPGWEKLSPCQKSWAHTQYLNMSCIGTLQLHHPCLRHHQKFQLYQNHKKRESPKRETKQWKHNKRKKETHHLCGLTAYCTKFSTFSLEWYSLLLRVQSRTLLYVRSFSSSWVAVLAVRCLAAELRMVWCPPLVDEVS